MKRSDIIRLAVMVLGAMLGTVYVSQLFFRKPQPPAGETSGEAPAAKPADVPSPPDAGGGDTGDVVEVPPGGEVVPPGGGEPARPIPPEFLANLQAALQETVDGTPEVDGRAFDYLLDYARQIGWEEIDERADPTLLSDIAPGMNVDKMAPAMQSHYQIVWAKNRGRWMEVQGEVARHAPRTLKSPIEGVDTVHEVLIRSDEENLWVLAFLLEPPEGKKVLVKGVFYKIRSLEVGGGRLDVAVLVGKGTGSGSRRVVPADEAYERRLFDAVRDMSSGWKGQGVYYLLKKCLALDPAEIDRRVVPGLLDRIAIPPQVSDDDGGETAYEALVEEHRPVWSEARGQFVRVTGRLAWVKPVEIPEGAVPGVSTAHWGRVKEDATGRLVDVVFTEKPTAGKDDLVTVRGAFYKMCRYQEAMDRMVSNGLWFFPVFVGRSLQSGVVHPEFRPDQLAHFLDQVADQTDLVQTESYYYLLWWLENCSDAAKLAQGADPGLPEKLRVNKYVALTKEKEADLQESWQAARGKPIQIKGSLIYVSEEAIPAGKEPKEFPHTKVWTGMIKMSDYHLCAFTALTKGDLEPDRGVRMTGIFFKSWRYATRTGRTGDAVYVLASHVERIPDPGQAPWMRTVGLVLLGVLGLATAGILIAVVVTRIQDRRAVERTRDRRSRGEQDSSAPIPPDPGASPGPERMTSP